MTTAEQKQAAAGTEAIFRLWGLYKNKLETMTPPGIAAELPVAERTQFLAFVAGMITGIRAAE